MFPKPDDVTSPHFLLGDVTLLSILVKNVVLEVSQEKILNANVSITFL